jgi:hypothetical protein
VILHANLESWKQLAGRIANRNLTWDEWRHFFPDEKYRRTIRFMPWPLDIPESERMEARAWEQSHPREDDDLAL